MSKALVECAQHGAAVTSLLNTIMPPAVITANANAPTSFIVFVFISLLVWPVFVIGYPLGDGGWSKFFLLAIKVGTPVVRRPLADPGVRNDRTGLLRETLRKAHETSADTMCQKPAPFASREFDTVVSALLAFPPTSSPCDRCHWKRSPASKVRLSGI